jgi:MYXO-CTERM domain-containing protein
VPVETLPPIATTPLPPPVAQTPPLEVLPETPPAPVTTTATTEDPRDSYMPWLLAGLVLVGALAFFGLRRRRRTAVHDEVRNRVYEPEPEPAAAVPVAAVPVAAATPVVTPVDTAPPVGRPELDLAMRPVRAGVSGQDARVEFELTVHNRGPVAAEDVRISTWMLAAGSSEAESALIVPRDHADTPAVTIGAGESRTMAASVALPTNQVQGDAVLPVVVADARYRLAGGGEGRTSASFAVGVPDGDGLAHFGIENPSGLHEGVVAKPLREPQRV